MRMICLMLMSLTRSHKRTHSNGANGEIAVKRYDDHTNIHTYILSRTHTHYNRVYTLPPLRMPLFSVIYLTLFVAI